MKSKEAHNKMSKSSLLRSLISPQSNASAAKMRNLNRPRDAPSELLVPESLFSQVPASHSVEAVSGRATFKARCRPQGCSDDQAATIKELRHARPAQHRRSIATLSREIKIFQKGIRAYREEQAADLRPQPQTELAQSNWVTAESRIVLCRRLRNTPKPGSSST